MTSPFLLPSRSFNVFSAHTINEQGESMLEATPDNAGANNIDSGIVILDLNRNAVLGGSSWRW